MKLPDRKFSDSEAVAGDMPLLVGITGPSSSGKTWTALELAFGVQDVRGGAVFVIDTEGGRALHYAPYFTGKDGKTFRHVPLTAPFSPLDYLAAIEHAIKAGAKIVIIDSMSHEHDGEGGVMPQVDAYLERKDDEFLEKNKRRMRFDERQKWLQLAHQVPKAQRKALNLRIGQLSDVTWIFCYRAHEKISVKAGEDATKAWQPISTSPLFYDMTLRLLLPPGSDGRPSFAPKEEAEKLLVKLPHQFRDWFKPGEQITREIGRRLALWARGGAAAPAEPKVERPAAPAPPPASGKAVQQTAVGFVTNVYDKAAPGKPTWYVILDHRKYEFWTKDAKVADRARVAMEVEAEMEFKYTMKPGHGSGEVAVLDGFEPKKEEGKAS